MPKRGIRTTDTVCRHCGRAIVKTETGEWRHTIMQGHTIWYGENFCWVKLPIEPLTDMHPTR